MIDLLGKYQHSLVRGLDDVSVTPEGPLTDRTCPEEAPYQAHA
jgi:hypothetical protein